MAKIISTILKGPGAIFDTVAGTGDSGGGSPGPLPAPATRDDTAETGADARREARRKRGRRSTILSTNGSGTPPARKTILGGS